MPDVSIGPVDGGSTELRGYLARPNGEGPFPAVVAIHEIFGIDDVLRRQADRLAAAGYLSFAPNLFSDGAGVGGRTRCLVSTFRSLATGRGKGFADIEAARRWLLARPDTTDRVGIIGFCMGGAFALLSATRGFDVAADNYGVLPPHAERALAGACPIVASYGGRDRLMPPRTADKLERVLSELDVPHDVHSYPEAGHSFLNDEPNGPRVLRPFMRVANVGPQPAAAADAWARIEAYFAEYLATPAS